jgi:hypothetical protein
VSFVGDESGRVALALASFGRSFIGRRRQCCSAFFALRAVATLAPVASIAIARAAAITALLGVPRFARPGILMRVGLQHGIRRRRLLVAHFRDYADRGSRACQRCGFGRLAGDRRFARSAFAPPLATTSLATFAAAIAPFNSAIAARRTLLALFHAAVGTGLQVCSRAFGAAGLGIAALALALAFAPAFTAAFTRLTLAAAFSAFLPFAAVLPVSAFLPFATSLLAVTLPPALGTALLAVAAAPTFCARLAVDRLRPDFPFTARLPVAAAPFTAASVTALAATPTAAAVSPTIGATITAAFAFFFFPGFNHRCRHDDWCRSNAEQVLDPCHETTLGRCGCGRRGRCARSDRLGGSRLGPDRRWPGLRNRRWCVRQHALDHRLLLVAALMGAACDGGRVLDFLGHVVAGLQVVKARVVVFETFEPVVGSLQRLVGDHDHVQALLEFDLGDFCAFFIQ